MNESMRHVRFVLLNIVCVVVTIVAFSMLSGISRIRAEQSDEYFKNFYGIEVQRDENGMVVRNFRWSAQDGVVYLIRQPNDNGFNILSFMATTVVDNQSIAIEIDQKRMVQFDVEPQLFRKYQSLVHLQWQPLNIRNAINTISLKNSAIASVAGRTIALAISDVVVTPITGTKYPDGIVIVLLILMVIMGTRVYFQFSSNVLIAVYSVFAVGLIGTWQAVVMGTWQAVVMGTWQAVAVVVVVILAHLWLRFAIFLQQRSICMKQLLNWGVILILCLFIGLGMQFSAPLVAESQVQKLLSDTLTRSMTTGVIETTTETYKSSPFGVDYVVEDSTIQSYSFYQTAVSPTDRGTGDVAEIVTVFLARPTRIDVVFTYDNIDTARRPRLFVYDDVSRLVDSANLDSSSTEFTPFETPYTSSVTLEPGLYKLRMMFARQDVASINIVFNPDSTSSTVLSFDDYVISNTKTLYFDIMPGQLLRLEELRDSQKVSWSRLPVGDWSKQYLPSPKESIQVKIRSAHGDWAFAELSLAGRNSAHDSEGGLPSSDIAIKAGELPYGLKEFKLYVVESKSNGYDMFMERFVYDMGVPGYRQDLVKIVVNNQLFGYMQLHEDWDTGLFEAGQFVEGPVIGYDTDPLLANPGHSWFEPRSYYNSKLISVDQEIDIGTLEMTQQYCPFAMGTTLASGIFYAGMHGLGADTRFLFDFRRHCINPIYKDMNTGVLALNLRKNGKYNFDQHPAILGLRMLSVLTPHWRPYTPTFASYFVSRNEKIGSQQELYFYWTVSPPVMNYSTDETRDAEFYMAMERLYSTAHTQRFVSRKRNYERTIALLNAQPHQSVELRSRATPLLSDVLPLEVWRNLVTIPTACDGIYIRTLIHNASGGLTLPDCRDVHRYTWRNTIVRQLLQQPVIDDIGIDFTQTVITQPHITFLYGGLSIQVRQHEGKCILS